MMVDNYELIKPYLIFESKDDFYHLQILKRKKENPHIRSNYSTINTYYVTSIEYLNEIWDDVKAICTATNSRASINLNRRSFKEISLQTSRKLLEHQIQQDYKSSRLAYYHCAGKYSASGKGKIWIIDIDDMSIKDDVVKWLDETKPQGLKFVKEIPSKSGVHLITNAFRTDKFVEIFPEATLHKNNPTNLFIP